MNDKYIIVGSEEWCSLSDINLPLIKARIDSGAKTSSIHAINIEKFIKNDEEWVSFDVPPLQDSRKVLIKCTARIVDTRIIKSTSGIREKRLIISTALTLGGETWNIELSLADRDTMGYRMLLGREAMQDRILVNPSVSFVYGDREKAELNLLYHARNESKTGLKIGVLASNPELYSNKRLIEAIEERGHEAVFLNIQQCYMRLDSSQPEVRYRGGTKLNDLDAIIPRVRPSLTYYGCALIRQFESIGVYCLNTSAAITQSRDKLYSNQLFSSNDIHIPTTGFAKSPHDTNDLIKMVNGAPLIIKLLEGTQGKGVVLAETAKAAESVINAFKSLQANILVQEFIKEAGGKDIRCFVVEGRVVASIQRQAAKGEFRANLHQGGVASIIKVTPEEKKLAIKASKVFNLQVAGVDIIRSNRGPLLLEVNSSPGLEGIETATGKDIAGKMIIAIEKKLRWKEKL